MYNENEQTLIWLTLFDKLTLPKAKALIGLFHEPKEIRQNFGCDKAKIQKVVGEDLYYKMLATDDDLLKSYIENLTNDGIKCITIASQNFPQKLFDISETPIVLFAKGDQGLLKQKSVAIVGTRNPTAYGREVTAQFATEIAKSGLVVVSGLASGVDKIAHESALKCGGKTIAVLGGGFNNIYPAMNFNLAKEIAEKGLLLSEYRPSVFATKYTFPFRNRIISGLSECVFIAEAPKKSGALYTKDYALEQGKAVFCVPSNITNVRAEGSNQLLKDKSAIIALSPEDVVSFCGVESQKEPIKKTEIKQVSLTESVIISALQDKNQTFDELQSLTKLEPKNLNSCLTMLQIRGLIKKLPGNEFSV